MKALSAAQQRVIDRMNDGWELGRDRTMLGRCWMQDGGIGLRMGSVVIDYAYHDSSQISGLGTQRLSLGYRF